MNSSMVAGERRWASARRGGMTVLGKVAVPKPLNLPSQRLENHGLDPNVEIVPRGSLSWGSRPSSSGSNPWICSSLPPNAESGTVSPSHLSGVPSSGGSGTRPSTAGSERTHEPVANSWGPNSRPSSASGTLPSNQTSSASLRPRSAENRPNSSQLSRFADPVPKSSAAWGPSGTAERLGVKSSKEDGFSLSSGDFPTLGTEKDNSMKNTDLEDHVRPSSASGRISHGKEDARFQADVRHETVNAWRADGPQSAENDINRSMDKWNRDNNPQQYFSPHTAPQHFDTWRGPPMNGPSGIWYGGQRPRGPPFGAPVRPGGFPMEPFPYYRPQIAPPPLAGSQSGPPPGPRGPHPKNGDSYRPQMPDAYARPGMPFRPGFYPGPPGPMAFEGYYGPPMGYERDIPYMGMPTGPPVYNSSYPGPAPDMGNSHGRNERGHHAGKSSEQVEVEDIQGPKSLTLKNRNQCDQREEGENWEQNVQQPDVSYPEKNRLPWITSRKKEWGAEEDTDEAIYAKRWSSGEIPCDYGYRVRSADDVEVKSFEGTGIKAVDDNWTSVSESFPQEMPRVPLGSERDSSVPAATKNSDLMHKIDALNAKMRLSDGISDSFGGYNREGKKNESQIYDMKINNITGEDSSNVGYLEKAPASRDSVSVTHEAIVPVSDKPIQPMIALSRRPYHGAQGGVSYRGKGKFNSQDADGRRQRPLTAESSSATAASSHNESAPHSYAHGPNSIEEASEKSVINPVGKIEGDSVETHDSSDIQAQRSKMREIAKQRALQLQKEEEERTREQRAKALAKLEELNRRALAGETESEKSEKGKVSNEIPPEQDESRAVDEPAIAEHNDASQAGESVEMPRNLLVESDVHEDVRDGGVREVASRFNDSRNKRTGYKQKQNNSFQKSFTEESVSNVAAEAHNDHTHVSTNDIKPHEHPSGELKPSQSNMPNTSGNVVEPPAPQRKKNNRSGKNKHKYDETPLPPVTSDVNPRKESVENIEAKDSLSSWERSFSTAFEPDRTIQAQEVLYSSLPKEESHDRAPNQWKPHPSRRQPRNQQAKLHSGDTAVWAPVRTQNKAKGSVGASPNAVHESTNSPEGNNNNTTQNNLKGKRAEMERYVPKPVAKELAQQVNIPNPSPLNVVSGEGVVSEVDSSHNKLRRTWRQRAPADSSRMKSPSSTSEPTKEIQQVDQFVKSEAGDGYNIPDNTNTVTKIHSVKDQGATGRGKRNAPKGENNNTDLDKTFSGEVGSKENRASSHWQPKSSLNSANNQHVNETESLNTETNRFPRKEHPSRHKAQGGDSSRTQPGQYVDVRSNVAREFEKKGKGRLYPQNQDHPVGPGELPPAADEDARIERNVPSGYRRNGRQNNHSVRGNDDNTRGDRTSGRDNRPRNGPPFRDNRQRQDLHYEYQPAGPFKSSGPERAEVPNDGADSTDGGHRERGQSRSRRGGNFNRRRSGPPAVVDSGWE